MRLVCRKDVDSSKGRAGIEGSNLCLQQYSNFDTLVWHSHCVRREYKAESVHELVESHEWWLYVPSQIPNTGRVSSIICSKSSSGRAVSMSRSMARFSPVRSWNMSSIPS